MQVLKIYKNYLKSINVELCKTEDFIENINKCNELLQDIENFKFLIPVIGNFSVGKSAFLNTFLEKDILSVDILPETAIATELHYAINERIEAIDKDNNINTYNINELSSFNDSRGKYVYCRLYLNSEKLKSIYPMILVDMPGFGSSLEVHNLAIDSYMYYGKHFLVLISIEDGTVNKNLEKILRNIENKTFTFCLTKTDLMDENQVKKVNEHILDALDNIIYTDIKVHNIYINSPKYIDNLIENIDLENIFKEIFNPIIKDLEFSIKYDIKSKKEALNNDKNKNKNKIFEIEQGINKIIDKKNELILNASSKLYEGRINTIINKIGNEISNYESEIVDLLISEDRDSVNNIIIGSINTVLSNDLDNLFSDMNFEIIDDLTFSLKGLNMETFSQETIDKIQQKALVEANYLSSKLKDFGNKNIEINRGGMYKLVTGIASVLTNIVNPIIELVIVFIPEIVNFFIKGHKEKKQKEELKSKVNSSIIPKIKSKIRPELINLVKEQIQKNINMISESIEKQQDLLKQANEQLDLKEEEIQNKIEIYDNIENYIIGIDNIGE